MNAVNADPPADDPIEVYLDALFIALPGSAREVRHTLAEVEAHLLDAASAGIAAGLDPTSARSAAVRQMGPVAGLADRSRHRFGVDLVVRRRLALATLLIGAAAGIAVGVAGLIARILEAGWGDRTIGVPFPPGSYTSDDCARWLRNYPGARDCVTAMTADHADDFLRNAAACGILGLLTLALLLVLRRRWREPRLVRAFPRGIEYIVGGVCALGAGVLLGGQGLDAVLVTRGVGAGQFFSLAIAAMLAAVFFAVRAKAEVFPRR